MELGIQEANFVPELPYGTRFFHDLEVDGILYLSVFDTTQSNVFNSYWLRSRSALAEPTGHPAVSIYSGLFNAYLDGERRIGCVTACLLYTSKGMLLVRAAPRGMKAHQHHH